MGKKRVYLSPQEVEKILQKAREEQNFVGTGEQDGNRRMVKFAKENGKVGDKYLMVIDPVYVHIPEWQRMLKLPDALNIGNHYNKYKWEVPKILYINQKLVCIDGMHRIFGAFSAGIQDVTVEVLTDITEQEAIGLFLEQVDRRNISPIDTYNAAIEAQKPEYIALRDICNKNNIQVKRGFNAVRNPVGILTSISDGVSMAKCCPELLDRILILIGKLQWNGGNIYEGKAYSAKVLRVLKKLYAYYEGKEELLEETLLNSCKGAKYFNNNLMELWQDSLFDYLSKAVERNMSIPVISRNTKTKKVAKTKVTAG